MLGKTTPLALSVKEERQKRGEAIKKMHHCAGNDALGTSHSLYVHQ